MAQLNYFRKIFATNLEFWRLMNDNYCDLHFLNKCKTVYFLKRLQKRILQYLFILEDFSRIYMYQIRVKKKLCLICKMKCWTYYTFLLSKFYLENRLLKMNISWIRWGYGSVSMGTECKNYTNYIKCLQVNSEESTLRFPSSCHA